VLTVWFCFLFVCSSPKACQQGLLHFWRVLRCECLVQQPTSVCLRCCCGAGQHASAFYPVLVWPVQ
jgi:hypothetical protein